jgi:ABC-2 type transport system permease protein
LRSLNQFAGVFEAELRTFLREAGAFLFMLAFPFMISLVTYGAGQALTGGAATPKQWFYQLIGFSVMMIVFTMTSNTAWYFRRGLMTGRLEYILAAPTSPLIVMAASSLSSVLFSILSFLTVASIGVLIVSGPNQLLNTFFALLYLAAALLPVIGLNLIVGVLTIVFKEPEPVTNAFNSVVAAVSGFAYPLTLLPYLLQTIGQALPYSHVVETSREILGGSLQLAAASPQLLLVGYLLVGIWVFRVGETLYVRKRGVSW